MNHIEVVPDRLSDLPLDLVLHILSFIPTIDAIVTSTLSKRLRYAWTKVPALDLNITRHVSFRYFENFVYRVLFFNKTPNLRVFRLHCPNLIDDKQVYSWISSIMSRGVLEIECYVPVRRKVYILRPASAWTFECKNLKAFKLSGTECFPVAKFFLPSLSILHLERLIFTDDVSLKNILSELPCLREFVIKHCVGLRHICVCSSSLKRLVMIYPRLHYARAGSEENMIRAPCLEYLRIRDYVLDYKLDKMPFLVEANFGFELFDSRDCGRLRMIDFLKQISSSKILHLNCNRAMALRHDQLPWFPSLICLIVTEPYQSLRSCWPFILGSMLEHAPNVESITYKVASRYTDSDKEKPLALPKSVPECLLTTLRVIDIYGFAGTITEKVAAKYLLQNATKLKHMRFHLSHQLVPQKTLDAFYQLIKVPMGSSTCKLQFLEIPN